MSAEAERVLDALNNNEVVLEAVALCRDSLGDQLLWGATARLREALSAYAREPFPWPERWSEPLPEDRPAPTKYARLASDLDSDRMMDRRAARGGYNPNWP